MRALLDRPAAAVLALDFDGTLAPIVPDPARARVLPELPPLLARLAPALARLAVITGRPAAEAVRLGDLDGREMDGLIVAGHYGLERWEAATGSVITPRTHPGVERARAELPDLLAGCGALPGTAIEEKGHAVAVHVRRTAEPERAESLLRAPLDRLARRTGLVVEPGRMVLELRPPGMDKGAALRELAAGSDGAVVFVGDDLGDLPAFAAVEELRGAGRPGLCVCSGSAEAGIVADRADLVVDGPAGVADLLQQVVRVTSVP